MGDLSVLGLTPLQERLYVLVATAAATSTEELALAATCTVGEAAAAVQGLVESGLVLRDAGDSDTWSVAPVELAVDALIRLQQNALDRAQAFGRDLAAQATRAADVHKPEQLVSVVVGHEAIGNLARQLQDSAVEEVLQFDRQPYFSPYALGGAGVDPTQHAKLAQGVSYRTIFDRSLLDDASIVARIRRDAEAGEQGRVLGEVPLKLLVVDRTMAMMPLITDPQEGPPAALFIRPSVLVESLVLLFDALWRVASPLRFDHDGDDPAENELRAVVRLLAAGLTDARIGRTLDLSERTVRRKVAAALDHLGAETRFQAALRARELGWI